MSQIPQGGPRLQTQNVYQLMLTGGEETRDEASVSKIPPPSKTPKASLEPTVRNSIETQSSFNKTTTLRQDIGNALKKLGDAFKTFGSTWGAVLFFPALAGGAFLGLMFGISALFLGRAELGFKWGFAIGFGVGMLVPGIIVGIGKIISGEEISFGKKENLEIPEENPEIPEENPDVFEKDDKSSKPITFWDALMSPLDDLL